MDSGPDALKCFESNSSDELKMFKESEYSSGVKRF